MNNTTITSPNTQTQQSSSSTLQLFIAILFFAGLFRIARFVHTLLAPYFRRRLDLHKRYKGGWALVTGGSQGIGQGIATELARSGFNLILVSRSLQKMKQAKLKIQKLYPKIQVDVHSVDFCQLTTEKAYFQTFRPILEKDISILVNNVGFYNPIQFDKLDFSLLRTQIKINLLPISVLTRLCGQKFMKREKSALINLSSGAAIAVYKGACNYSASKSFDDFFSRAIQYQLRSKVDVLTVRPYFISSSMTRNLSGFGYYSPQTLGKEVVDALGNTDICYGGILHRIQGALSSQMNEKLWTFMSNIAVKDFTQKYQKQK